MINEVLFVDSFELTVLFDVKVVPIESRLSLRIMRSLLLKRCIRTDKAGGGRFTLYIMLLGDELTRPSVLKLLSDGLFLVHFDVSELWHCLQLQACYQRGVVVVANLMFRFCFLASRPVSMLWSNSGERVAA